MFRNLWNKIRTRGELTPSRARKAIRKANLDDATRSQALARFDRHIARNEPCGRALHAVMAWANGRVS